MSAERKNTNRHLVDQMADAKDAKDEAAARYDALREAVLASGDLVGDEYLAQVSERTTTRLDRKKVEKLLTKAQLASCLQSSPSVIVKLARRSR
jgi:hypothetical protein